MALLCRKESMTLRNEAFLLMPSVCYHWLCRLISSYLTCLPSCDSYSTVWVWSTWNFAPAWTKREVFVVQLGAFRYSSMSDSDAEELSVGAPSPVSAKDNHGSNMIIMDGDEEGSSSVSTSSYRMRNEGADTINNDSNGATQRHPTCALCKNHQTISTLKGHKRYCPWRNCVCELCYGTTKKRKINAEQVALRRAQAQDEELRKKGIIQQLERISSSTLTSPSSVQSPPQECGKVRPRPEQPSLQREDRPPKVKIDVPARPAAVTSACQSNPVVFGQQLSLGSILMGQNVSLLRESVCDTRLGFDLLRFLFRIIQDVKGEIDRVSCQLNEIHHEIQIKIHSGNVNFMPNPNLVYGQDQLQKGNPATPVSIHNYQIPSSFQTQFRATVINGPFAPFHQPIYPN